VFVTPQARPWSKALLAVLALLSLLALLPAATPAAGADSRQSRIRVVHAVPDVGAVDVYLGTTRLAAGATFFGVSEYLVVNPTHARLRAIPAGDDINRPSRILANLGADIRAGRDYTAVVGGSVASRNVRISLLTDDNKAPAPGNVRIRAAHFSPDAPAVDVFIDGERSSVRNLRFRSASGYLEVPAGSYSVGIAPAGGSPIFTADVTLEPNTVYTAWANGLLGGSGAQAFKLTPSVDATFETARVRAVHAIPDIAGSPVDVFVNGAKIVTFDFFTATDYLPLTAGTYDVRVTLAGGDPATEAVIQANVSVEGGKEYSIIARGTGGNFGASVLEDDNSRPVPGQARVRVAHFSPDAPAVDIFLNGERSPVTDLSFLSATGYLDVPPGDYEIGVAPAGGSPIYTTTATIEAGKVYTAWANGLLGGSGAQAFKVTPTIDASYPVAEVRLLHAVPDAPTVDVYLGATRVAAGVRFGDLSGFLPVDAGRYEVRVTAAGDTATVIGGTITLEAGRSYTAAAVGLLSGEASLLLLVENRSRPVAGRSRLDVVHLSPNAPAVDVLSGDETLIDALSFKGDASAELAAGPRALRVTLDASGAEVLNGSLNLPSGGSATLFVIGLAGDAPAEQRLRLLPAGAEIGAVPAAEFRVHLPLVRR
jgi:hypothetical protein